MFDKYVFVILLNKKTERPDKGFLDCQLICTEKEGWKAPNY